MYLDYLTENIIGSLISSGKDGIKEKKDIPWGFGSKMSVDFIVVCLDVVKSRLPIIE